MAVGERGGRSLSSRATVARYRAETDDDNRLLESSTSPTSSVIYSAVSNRVDAP
jgi:hypothetical protein